MDIKPLGQLTVIENKTLSPSGGATPSFTSDPIKTDQLKKLHVYVKNTGAGTATVTLKAASDLSKTMTGSIESIEPITIGVQGSGLEYALIIIPLESIPSALYFVLESTDSEDSATITVVVDRWR